MPSAIGIRPALRPRSRNSSDFPRARRERGCIRLEVSSSSRVPRLAESKSLAGPAALRRLVGVLGVCVGMGLAHVGTSAMPFQIGALMDGSHRSASEAGLFGFFQVGALAAGMILISATIDRMAPRRIAWLSCVLVAAAYTGLYYLQAFPLQIACAAVAGIGYGLVFA